MRQFWKEEMATAISSFQNCLFPPKGELGGVPRPVPLLADLLRTQAKYDVQNVSVKMLLRKWKETRAFARFSPIFSEIFESEEMRKCYIEMVIKLRPAACSRMATSRKKTRL
jgi:hypothetical protein